MTTTATWYSPLCGTGGFLIELTNPPFTMTDHNEQTTTPELLPEMFSDLLVKANRATRHRTEHGALLAELARLAYAAGADAELEACCEWLEGAPYESLTRGQAAGLLRTMRGPKPMDLKKKALNDLSQIMASQKGIFDGKPFATIRQALESLPDPD